eukprot:5914819-Amphidinium_carterae.1
MQSLGQSGLSSFNSHAVTTYFDVGGMSNPDIAYQVESDNFLKIERFCESWNWMPCPGNTSHHALSCGASPAGQLGHSHVETCERGVKA